VRRAARFAKFAETEFESTEVHRLPGSAPFAMLAKKENDFVVSTVDISRENRTSCCGWKRTIRPLG
jgi:hypothetical protein